MCGVPDSTIPRLMHIEDPIRLLTELLRRDDRRDPLLSSKFNQAFIRYNEEVPVRCFADPIDINIVQNRNQHLPRIPI